MNLLRTNNQYRLLWISFWFTGVSVFMLEIVQGWITIQLTDSAFWVGVVSGCSGVFSVVMSLPGGVLADRFQRWKIVVFSNVIIVLSVSLMALAAFLDRLYIWQIIILAIVIGAVGGIRGTSSLVLTLDVVGKNNLVKAAAANWGANGFAGVVGPYMIGYVIRWWGIAWSYLGIVFAELVAAGLLLVMSGSHRRFPDVHIPSNNSWELLKSGARYVVSSPLIMTLILMGVVMESFAWSHATMLPVMAKKVFDLGADGLGQLRSAGFVGLLLGTGVISIVGVGKQKGLVLMLGSIAFCICMIFFSMSRIFPLSLLILALAYAIGATYDTTLSALIQTSVPAKIRGRVVSFQTMTWGLSGASGFYMGPIASIFGAPMSIIMGSVVALLYLVFAFPTVKRIKD